MASSSVYETAPQGEVLDQPDFLNAVPARAHRARPRGAARRRARRWSESSAASPAARATGRARSTWTCCCSATSSTARSASRCRTARSRAGASCSSRCSSSTRSWRCRTARGSRPSSTRCAIRARAPGGQPVTPQPGGLRCWPVVSAFRDAGRWMRWTTRWSSQTFAGTTTRRLVAAALACRACLSGDVEWSLRVDDFEGTVECRCRELRLRARGVAHLRAGAAALAHSTRNRTPGGTKADGRRPPSGRARMRST